MNTLYIDTHNDKIIIIIFKDRQVFIKKEIITNHNHSNTIMLVLVDALKEANIEVNDLNEVIVVNGPGSFTGVRLGVTIAKAIAYTVNIPIKVMSSLLIKAVSFTHEDVNIVEREKNGVFIGTFDKDSNLKSDYIYLSNVEFEKRNEKNDLEDITLDYDKIISYSKNIENINPHAVKPLYIKKIEVQK